MDYVGKWGGGGDGAFCHFARLFVSFCKTLLYFALVAKGSLFYSVGQLPTEKLIVVNGLLL